MKKNIILTLFFIFLHISVFTQSNQKLVQYFMSNNLLDTTYNQLVWNVAIPFLNETPYAYKLNINSTLDTNKVNIYIYKNDPKHLAIPCNCYFRGENVIICDKSVFNFFSGIIKVKKEDQPIDSVLASINMPAIWANVNSSFEYFIFQWLIGHEIGHLVGKHKLKSSDNSLNEIQADSFFIEGLNRNQNKLDQFYVWLGLSNLISELYPNETLMKWQKGDSTKIKIYKNPNLHPPGLVRFISMVEQLLANKVIVDESGYYPFIRNSMVLINDPDKQPKSICSEYTDRTSLQQFRDIEYDNPSYLSKQIDFNAFDLDQIIAFINQSKYNTAYFILDKILSQKQDSLLEIPDLNTAWLLKGLCAYNQYAYKDALLAWNKIDSGKLLPEFKTILLNGKAQISFTNNDFEAARNEWAETLRIAPRNSEAKLGFFMASLKTGKLNQTEFRSELKRLNPLLMDTNILKYDLHWNDRAIAFLKENR